MSPVCIIFFIQVFLTNIYADLKHLNLEVKIFFEEEKNGLKKSLSCTAIIQPTLSIGPTKHIVSQRVLAVQLH